MQDHASHGAELSARITAAQAAVDTYRAEVDHYLEGSGPTPHWDEWASRLAGMLLMLLDELDVAPAGPGVALPGGGWISGSMRAAPAPGDRS